MKITMVTGNPNKLKELQAMAPADIEFAVRSIDLPEIQSLDLHAIVEDKAKRAYKIINGPVIVEDVAAGLDELAGLPGPFYKFFREELGDEILLKLAKISSDKVTICCTAAFYDGKQVLFGDGEIRGTIVFPRGVHSFGFDPFVVPEGYKHTMAEMTPEQKNTISHRGQAFANLLKQI